MTHLRISEAAALLRVSDDTVRRWISAGHLQVVGSESGGPMTVSSAEVAAFVRERRDVAPGTAHTSARNRLPGIVTDVQRDGLVAVVEIQAGPYRLVSLMTREASEELELRAGSLVDAVVKSTAVVVEPTASPRTTG